MIALRQIIFFSFVFFVISIFLLMFYGSQDNITKAIVWSTHSIISATICIVSGAVIKIEKLINK